MAIDETQRQGRRSASLDGLQILSPYRSRHGVSRTLKKKFDIGGRLLTNYNCEYNTHFLKLSERFQHEIGALKEELFTMGLIPDVLAEPDQCINIKNKTQQDSEEIVKMSKNKEVI
jgi:hypothetical protein